MDRCEMLNLKNNEHLGIDYKLQKHTMEEGYKEMAAINLSISKLYFEAEREVESYYDHIAECE